MSPHARVIDEYILNDKYYKEVMHVGISYVKQLFNGGSIEVSKHVSYTHLKDNYYTNETNEVVNFSKGRVIYVGKQEIMGNYVIVLLENSVEVTYANLSDLFVELYDSVDEGSIIGTYNDEVMLIFNEGVKEIDYKTFEEKYN